MSVKFFENTWKRKQRPMRDRNRVRLLAEQLEDRAVPSTLTGSNFQIDGDRTDGGNDWASLNPTGASPPPSAVLGYANHGDFTKTNNPGADDSFSGGSSENDVVVTPGFGSIPPQKADLGPAPISATNSAPNTAAYGPGFEFYTETIGGNIFLYLDWCRNNTNGTVNYDFEINQKPTDFSQLDSKGKIHLIRTGDANQNGTDGGPLADDLLITFDIAKGGNTVNLAYRKWTGTQWSDPIALNNTVAIAAVSSSSDPLFGEAGINLTAARIMLTDPNDPAFKCESFSQAWVHSRSSDSFSSEIKDIIAPTPVNLTNCSEISGYKFNDLNANGVWNKAGADGIPGNADDELPLAGWTINLSGPVSGSQVTDANGFYEFGPENGFNLTTGVYTVTETLKPGWTQTAPTPVPPGSYTINVPPIGTHFENNNFGNVALGHIIVHKTVVGPDQSFTFTPSWGAAFPLSNGQQNDSGPLPVGNYSVTEAIPSGWNLTDVTFTETVSTTGETKNLGTGLASVTLEAGETIHIYYIDTKKATVTVVKNTVGGDGTFSFDASGTLNGQGTPSVPDPLDITTSGGTGSSSTFVFSNLPSGGSSLIFDELAKTGWDFTSLVITGGDADDTKSGDVATLNVEPGENITVTYTNTKRGHIVVDKVTVDASGNHISDTTSFTFNTTGSGYSGFSLTDAATPNDSGALVPGSYSVAEVVPAGWDLTKLEIDGVSVAGPTANLTLGAGQTIYVTFTDTPQTRAFTFSGHKFLDADGNGVRGAGEVGLNGWDINLSGDSTQSTTTATVGGDVGFYSFSVDITFGQTLNMTVQEVQKSGWTQTTPAGGSYSVSISWLSGTAPTFVAPAGKQNALDFGNRQGSIFWEKRDGSNGNVLLGGATFTVSPNPTGGGVPLVVADDTDGVTSPTDVDQDPDPGQFLIKNVPVGVTYTITETVPPTPAYDKAAPQNVQVPASGSVNVTVGPFYDFLPQLKVEKTPDPGAADLKPGDTATFSIKVSNIGLGKAVNVKLDDVLFDDKDNDATTPQVHVLSWFVSDANGNPVTDSDLVNPPNWSMTPNQDDVMLGSQNIGDGDYLHVDIGDLAPGANFTIYVSAVIPTNYLGSGVGGGGNNLGNLFELDGNTVEEGSKAGEDWNTFAYVAGSFTSTGSAENVKFVKDGTGASTFTGGGSKDTIDLTQWQWKDGSTPPKDDIFNAYAAGYHDPSNGDFIIYFGQDRGATNGDAQVGAWFFQKQVVLDTATHTFRDLNGNLATHDLGDILILANFTNGGKVGSVQVFEWVGDKNGSSTSTTPPLPGQGDGPIQLLNSTGEATAITNDATVGTINTPWRSGIPVNGFFEGGINLTKIFLQSGQDVPCLDFHTFVQESRASQSPSATLKDFVLGQIDFDTCTHVDIPNTAYAGADNNARVSDTGQITVSNELPPPSLPGAQATLAATAVLPPSGGSIVTAAAAPIAKGPAASGQSNSHSVSAAVLDLVFSDLDGHDLGSGLHDLLHGLAKGRRRS